MRLPQVSGREVVKALQKDGFLVVSQKGSHIKIQKLRPPAGRITIIIPDHKTLKKGTLSAILHQAGLTLPRFLELLA